LLAQKLRRSMIDPQREPLEGVVEVDQTEIPFRTDNSFFDPVKSGKILIAGAGNPGLSYQATAVPSYLSSNSSRSITIEPPLLPAKRVIHCPFKDIPTSQSPLDRNCTCEQCRRAFRPCPQYMASFRHFAGGITDRGAATGRLNNAEIGVAMFRDDCDLRASGKA
jgi:hypothetical protein